MAQHDGPPRAIFGTGRHGVLVMSPTVNCVAKKDYTVGQFVKNTPIQMTLLAWDWQVGNGVKLRCRLRYFFSVPLRHLGTVSSSNSKV